MKRMLPVSLSRMRKRKGLHRERDRLRRHAAGAHAGRGRGGGLGALLVHVDEGRGGLPPRRSLCGGYFTRLRRGRTKAGDRGQDYYERRYQSRDLADLMRRAQECGYTRVKSENLPAARSA